MASKSNSMVLYRCFRCANTFDTLAVRDTEVEGVPGLVLQAIGPPMCSCGWYKCPNCGACGCGYHANVETRASYRRRRGRYGTDYAYHPETSERVELDPEKRKWAREGMDAPWWLKREVERADKKRARYWAWRRRKEKLRRQAIAAPPR